MKEESPLRMKLIFPQDIKSTDNLLLMFLNIENLEKNIANIEKNPDIMTADILVFTETHAKDSRSIDIKNYDRKLIQNVARRMGGYVIYTKTSVTESVFNATEIKYGKNSYIFDLITKNTIYIFIHHNDNDNVAELVNKIISMHEKISYLHKRNNTILIGHINFDFNKNTKEVAYIITQLSSIRLNKIEIINNISENKHDLQFDICFTEKQMNVYNFYATFNKNKIIWTVEDMNNDIESKISDMEKPLSQMSISEEF